jgi:hypothetical protein
VQHVASKSEARNLRKVNYWSVHLNEVPGALSPGVKRPGREVDHSPPTSAEVKKNGSIHPLPHTPSWRSA